MIFERLRKELTLATYAGRTLAGLTLAAACSSGVNDTPAPNQGGMSGASSGGGAQDGGKAGSGGDVGGGGGEAAGSGAPGSGGSEGGTGGAGGWGGSSSLPPLDPDKLVCFGDDYGQDSSSVIGQCCYKAMCYAPSAGADCVRAEDAAASLSDYPAGSGECSCDDSAHPIVQGPFAPNPAAAAAGEGDCCYLVGVISCAGRPLRVEGEAVLAGVVRRADWGF